MSKTINEIYTTAREMPSVLVYFPVKIYDPNGNARIERLIVLNPSMITNEIQDELVKFLNTDDFRERAHKSVTRGGVK